FLNMGMTMQQVIAASTWQPAQQIKRTDLGHLSVGAVADIAVLKLENGNFGFVDVYGAKMNGKQRLTAELTLKDGRVYWDLNGLTRENWEKLGIYNSQGDGVWDGTTSGGVRTRR
ncbi:MAG: amidohydrolase family protein, partial [Acidobacteria bacterium]|nr:amidohydrolase family protein [Acidobacteriota bacterium]